MKIGKTNESMQPDVIGRVGTRPSGGAPGPAAGDVEQTDSVQLSTTSLGLKTGAGEPMDMAKVQAVTAAIESGHFQVDAQKVADKMISEAAQLLERIASSDGA